MIERPQISLAIVNNQIQATVQHLIDTKTEFSYYKYVVTPKIIPSALTLKELLRSHKLTWKKGRLEKVSDRYVRCIGEITLHPINSLQAQDRKTLF